MDIKTIVFWGTFDKGKPRIRILLSGARALGLNVIECHAEIWEGVDDKSQISGATARIRRILLLFRSYPSLVLRYLRLPPHDVVVVGYLGHFDVLVLWPFAKLRRVPICWDVFISLYDTVAVDRKIVGKKSIASNLLYALEWMASKASNQIFLDTKAHAEYFERLYRLPSNGVKTVFVGAETDTFKKKTSILKLNNKFNILFYGQYIPLHGIDTIVHAAKIMEDAGENICWIFIGKGQERTKIDRLINELCVKSIQLIPWVPYEQLVEYINVADISLGIFGDSGKALRVIPNKVFQIIACRKPLITGDTPAMRELIGNNPIVKLVAPGTPEALVKGIRELRDTTERHEDLSEFADNLPVVGPIEVGKQFIEVLNGCISK